MKKNLLFKKKRLTTYNQTFSYISETCFPKNISELKKILKNEFKNKNFLLRTGLCGHGDKSSLNKSNFVLSLKMMSKMSRINRNRNIITVEAGAMLFDLTVYLKKNGYFIFNVPGGKNVSLGGAISGNVHGRFSSKKFANFGDNIESLKIINEKGKIKSLKKNSNLFNRVIGGQSSFGIIVEATLKVNKIRSYSFIEKKTFIKNLKEFKKFNNNNEKYFGYLNIFDRKNFSINCTTISPLKEDNKNISNFSMKDINLPRFLGIFLNRFSIRILYIYLFKIKKYLSRKNYQINFEKSIYVSNLIHNLPIFFKRGFIEIQISIDKKKLVKFINELKEIYFVYNIYPLFLILKRMNSSKKKYLFNFPKFEHSISMGFSKLQFQQDKNFFKNLYQIFEKYNCNLYIAKDETFLDCIEKTKLKKKYLKDFIFKKYPQQSSNFNEKIKKILR